MRRIDRYIMQRFLLGIVPAMLLLLALFSFMALAEELDEDPDILLALAGKVSSDLQEVIRKRPKLFADLIRQLRSAPDRAVLRLVREVRDGDW